MPGHGLRSIRERLQLTLKDVEFQSRQISEARRNQEYLFSAGRLSQVENSFSLPSLYKLAALSEIYRTPYQELLNLYGINTGENGGAWGSVASGNGEAGREQSSQMTPTPVWV